MLRLNLLRGMAASARPASPPPPPQRPAGPLRYALLVLLGLLALGAAALFWMRPGGMDFTGMTGARERKEAARADSLRRMEALYADASRLVAGRQALAIEWLYQLEAALPEGGDPVLSLSSFTLPDSFLLRGTARTGEALSALQEALVLMPGMDLRRSEADGMEKAMPAEIAFLFAGTVEFPNGDSSSVANRVVPAVELPSHLSALLESAMSHGIAFSPPEPGTVRVSNTLQIHPYRLSGRCDSAGFEAIRHFLESERQRNSPFSVQRVTLKNSTGPGAVFLDIMAFAP